MKTSFNGHFNPWVKKWGLLTVQIITLVLYQWLFYRQTGGTCFFTPGTGLMFAFAILCTLFFSLFRVKWLYPAFLLIFIIQLYANILYYRTYYAFIPFSSYLIAGNLKEFDGAVILLMKGKDVWLLLPFLAYLGISRWWNRQDAVRIKLKERGYALLIAAASCTAISLIALKGSGIGRKFDYEKVEATHDTCFPAYFAFSVYEYIHGRSIRLTPEEQDKIRSFIPDDPATRAFTPKNLILILIESLESWPLFSQVNGRPVTPFLNSLLNDTRTWHTPYLLPQTHDGGSIDAQLILNTGLLPPRNGAFAFLYEDHLYPSLSAILKTHGYARTALYQACPPSVWNQAKVAAAFGTDEFKDISCYSQPEPGGNMLPDFSFLDQTAEMLGRLPGPFYAQVVTQSSHSPFLLPDNKKRLPVPAGRFNETFTNYLQVIAYVDESLQNFFEKMKKEGLYDRSIFVLTGDHCTSYGTAKLSEWIEPYCDTFHIKGNFVPLIIVNGGVGGSSTDVAAQVDVFPTLIDLLGIDSQWKGLSTSLFSKNRRPGVCSAAGDFTGDSILSSHCREMWEISDLIIRSDYFRHSPTVLSE